MNEKIVVIGSTNIDMIMKVPKIPRPGETIGEGEFSKVFGGKGANQAVAAARAGGDVTFVSCLGDDIFAESAIENFKGDNINVDYVFQEKGAATGTALIFVDEKGGNSIAVAPGANYKLSPQHIDKALTVIQGAELIVLQLEIPYETVKYVIELAAKQGKKVLLNPAPARQFDDDVLRKLYLLVVNETEAELISGITVSDFSNVENTAQKLLTKGPEIVIITLGAKGAYLATNSTNKMIDGFKVKAVDTTAAGDIFCGNLAFTITKQQPISEAIKFANAAAALSATRLGAQPSAPHKNEILQFIKEKNC